MRLILISAAAMVLAAACGDTGGTAEKATAPAAPAAAPAAAPVAPAAPTAAELEREKLMAGLTKPYADQAAWTAACKEAGVDGPICDCAGKKAVETVGVNALYSWVWEGYIRRDGAAQMRSGKFFTDNGLSNEVRQKFADAIGTCYQ